MRGADLGVPFPFSVALAGALFVGFGAPEPAFGFVVPVASCTPGKCQTRHRERDWQRTFFGLVFVEEIFFFDAADPAFVAAVFFGAALFVTAGFAAATALVVFALSSVVIGAFFIFDLVAGAFLVLVLVGAGLAFGLVVAFACRVQRA